MRDDARRLMYERFAKDLEESLSGLLRMEVQVRVMEVCERTGERFLDELETPACLYRLRAESWCDDVCLDMNPSVLHPMLDRLLGGGLVAEPIPRRSLTNLEIQLSQRVMTRLAGSLETILGTGLSDRLRLEKLSDDLAGPPGWESQAAVQVIRLRIAMGGVEGVTSFGWPLPVIEQLRDSTMSQGAGDDSGSSRGAATTRRAVTSEGTARTRVELRVGLAEIKIWRHELRDLSVGDIITTDHAVDDPLEVRVGGVPRFWASPGILGDRTAFRVMGAIPPAVDEHVPTEP